MYVLSKNFNLKKSFIWIIIYYFMEGEHFVENFKFPKMNRVYKKFGNL